MQDRAESPHEPGSLLRPTLESGVAWSWPCARIRREAPSWLSALGTRALPGRSAVRSRDSRTIPSRRRRRPRGDRTFVFRPCSGCRRRTPRSARRRRKNDRWRTPPTWACTRRKSRARGRTQVCPTGRPRPRCSLARTSLSTARTSRRSCSRRRDHRPRTARSPGRSEADHRCTDRPRHTPRTSWRSCRNVRRCTRRPASCTRREPARRRPRPPRRLAGRRRRRW